MAEINITPFTDVVLVLLIIFMITTPLLVHHGIKIEMPTIKQADAETDKSIVIVVDANGGITINDKRVEMSGLKTYLMAKILNYSNPPVVVKADKNAKYDYVIQVMDIAKQAGAKKFALGVELEAVKQLQGK
jgi:biopolymer transport protein ExbD